MTVRHWARWVVSLTVVLMAVGGTAAEQEARVAPAPAPPTLALEYVLSEARITGAVSGAEVAELTAELKGTSFVDGWVRIPVFRTPVAVTGYQVRRGDRKKVLLVRSSTGSPPRATLRGSTVGYDLAVGKKGDFVVRIDLAVQVSRGLGARTVTLPGVAAAASQVELTIPEAGAEFTVEPRAELKWEAVAAGVTKVTLFGITGPSYALRWQARAAAPVERALIFGEQLSVVSLSRGRVSLHLRTDYTIVGGSVGELVLELPARYEVTSVTGEGISGWEVTPEEEGARLTVSLVQPITGSYHLELEAQRSEPELPSAEKSLDVPVVRTVGAEREGGSLVVRAATGIRLVPEARRGLRQVTVSEVPGYSPRPAFPIALAYEFVETTWRLAMLAGEVTPRVSATVAARADVQQDAVLLAARLNYQIQDAPVFGFRLSIPPGARVLELTGANINTYTVEEDVLRVDLRAAAQGSYELALTLIQAIEKPEAVRLPTVRALGAERETGYLLVLTRPDTQAEPLEVKGINQIDPSELPASLATPEGGGLAFQYLRQPYEVVLSVGAVQPEIYTTSLTSVSVGERGLEVATHVDYDIRKAGVFRLRLAFPEGLRLTENIEGAQIEDWRLDGEAHELIVNLRTRTTGAFALDVKAEATVSDLVKKGVVVPVILPLEVKRGTGYVAVRTDASYRLRTAQMTSLTEVDVRQLPPSMQADGTPAVLAYRFYQLPWALQVSVEPILPVITAETFTLVSIGEALEQVTTRIDYSVQFAGASQFEVQLPEGASNVDFVGQGIKHREELEEEGHWRISMQSAREGSYPLVVTFERKMEEVSAKLTYSGVTTLGTEREKGYIVLTPRTNVEITPLAEELQAVSQVDVKEIPETFTAGLTVPLIWAFKYISHPFILAAEVKRHEDVSVLVAVVESANLVTKISREGELLTDLLCFVRNNRQQFLKISLPKGVDAGEAALWEASVAGNPVRLGRSEEGDVLVPISGVAGPEEAFPIRLRYRTRAEKLGRWGTLVLEAPGLEVPVMRLRWQLILPRGYELVADYGDMERTERIVEQEGLIREWQRRRQSGQRGPLPANIAQQAQMEQLPGRGRGLGAVSMDTGPMVTEGLSYYFVKLLAAGERQAGPPGTIRSTYLRKTLALPGQVIVVAVLVGMGLLLLKQAVRLRLSVALGVAVLLSFIRSFGGVFYSDLLSAAALAAWVVAAVLLIHWLAALLPRPSARRREAPAGAPPGVPEAPVPPEEPGQS